LGAGKAAVEASIVIEVTAGDEYDFASAPETFKYKLYVPEE